jgi:hypothetical protein
MATVSIGKVERVNLEAGQTLTVVAPTGSRGYVRRNDATRLATVGQLSSGSTVRLGPYPSARVYFIHSVLGPIDYSVGVNDLEYASDLGNVRPFTGDRTLTLEDNGLLLRCDDNSNVTVSVPGNLPEGFNVGVWRWGTGTVTFAAVSGSTKRSSETQVTSQYGLGSVTVAKNVGDVAAEFTLGGGVS